MIESSEAMTKLIFLRLDPLLRMLCEAVQTLKASSNRPSLNTTRYFGLLRTTTDLVDELQNQLEGIASLNSEVVSEAVFFMLDYIMLPILGILRTLGPTAWGSMDDDATEVQQSAIWKCIEHAARVLPTLLQLLPLDKTPARSIPTPKVTMYASACVGALPTGLSVLSEKHRLDHGEACMTALAMTIQRLIEYDPHAVGSSVATRLWDVAMALVESSTTSESLQCVALDLIQALLVSSSSQQSSTGLDWQRIFPGVYSGLYRRILASLRHSHSNVRALVLTEKTIVVLVKFLECSLLPLPKPMEDALTKSLALTRLHALAAPSNLAIQTEPDEKPFLVEVRRRLPSTLIVLVQSLVLARSASIRAALLPLSRVLLIDTREYWKDAPNLITVTLESCIVLRSDTEESVSMAACQLVSDYFLLHCDDVSTIVGPRIVALVEQLPLLVQGARETELRAAMQLIRGYLQLPVAVTARVRFALTAESVLLTLRRAWMTLLDVKFETLDEKQSGTIVLSFLNTESMAITPSSRVQYLSESMRETAVSMIHAFGAALGPYHVTLFVDACMADVYRSCLDRAERRVAWEGRSHIQWIHEWIGAFPLVQALLLGGFSSVCITDCTKRRNRVQRYLVPLMKTIFPIVTTFPLWEFPSSKSPVSGNDATFPDRAVAAAAFRGSVAMSCALLHLVGGVVELLEKDSIVFLPVILYPVLDKASDYHASVVREVAYHTLQSLASSSGCTDVVTFIAEHMESSLMGPMLSRLRIPGGRSLMPFSDVDYGTLRVLKCATTVLRIVTESLKIKGPATLTPVCNSSILPLTEELTVQLTTRFDHASTRMAYDVETSLQFIQLFDAAIVLLQATWQVVSYDECRSRRQAPIELEPWLNLLDPYKKDSDDHLSPKEGFEKHLKEKEKLHKKVEESEGADREHALVRDTAFCSQLARRLGYLLSHPDLKVQIRSCEVLDRCFQFLGGIASDESIKSCIANGPKTAVMRQVHASWPAIAARLNFLCPSVLNISAQKVSLIVERHESVHQSKNENVGEHRVYLSKLLSLIAAMVECAEDFMASRFREIVWPWIVKLLRTFTSRTTLPVVAPLGIGPSSALASRAFSSSPKSMTESEITLLYTTIDCLKRVYSHRPVGLILIGLISDVVTLLFPFLDHDTDSIALVCMEALRSASEIDCDALWRPILKLAGQKLPPCPLTHVHRIEGSSSTFMNSSESLQVRAKELVVFISELPEQPL